MITLRASADKPASFVARAAAALLACVLLTACAAREAPRPIVVQGAMDVEIRKLAGAIQNATEERVSGWTFWRGTIDGYPVVISKTLKGMENAAAATAIAAERYHPIAIINQGTAGGHVAELHVYDIVLGRHAVNLGSFKTGYRAGGRGSDMAEWNPLDLMRSDGSAGQDPNARTMRRFAADEGLLAAARRARGPYQKGPRGRGRDRLERGVEQRDRSHPAFSRPVRHDGRGDGGGLVGPDRRPVSDSRSSASGWCRTTSRTARRTTPGPARPARIMSTTS